eukprot:TRINITY_DN2481_c1_g1_i1.p2 TRINITY_DN2481_c1_g1~~TRINITY_DN2481_c1_g1_i1.p2  ORF type:complete len:313 (+),score=123.40 TRINITY_DN2481_c1_g1_i1:474-1412(+)
MVCLLSAARKHELRMMTSQVVGVGGAAPAVLNQMEAPLTQLPQPQDMKEYLYYFEALPNPLHERDFLREQPAVLGALVHELRASAQAPFLLDPDHSFEAQLEAKLECAALASYLYNAKLLSSDDAIDFADDLLSHTLSAYPNILAFSVFINASLQFYREEVLDDLVARLKAALVIHGDSVLIAPHLQTLIEKLEGQMQANNANVLPRTVRVSGIDSHAKEKELLDLLRDCGHVVKLRLCGRREDATIFGFFQFKTVEGAQRLIHKGQNFKLGSRQLKVEMASSSIKDSRQAGLHLMRGSDMIGQTALRITSK